MYQPPCAMNMAEHLGHSWSREDHTLVSRLSYYLIYADVGSSNVVEYLKMTTSELSGHVQMACFYCDFRRAESRDPVNVVGTLVKQYCSQIGSFPEELELAFTHSNSGAQKRKPTLFTLVETLKMLAKQTRVALLIDALDECDERGDILSAISSLSAADNINILITSRAELDIEEGLQNFTLLRIESKLQAVSEDIRAYISHRLEKDQKLRWLSPSLKSDITELLNSRSHGM